MALLDDILAWATSDLIPWQQDALRRLFQSSALTPDDFDDLFAMLKSGRGMPDDKNRKPVPFAKEHIPGQATAGSTLVLRSLRDLKNVNRIAAGQTLPFSPTGMTILYGGNGTGKSGYARVLKRACRARDLSETVHPNAYDASALRHVPEAVFDVTIAGKESSISWKRDSKPPDELAVIAVFDGKCARAYLDDEQEVAYLPYGLDIVENLGQRVLPELSSRLQAELTNVNTDVSPFADLVGETAVGKLVTALSATTNPEAVKTLATLSAEENARLAALDKMLAEQDPTAKAKQLRQAAQRIESLISRIDSALSWVSDTAVEKLQTIDTESEAAIAAASAAAAQFRSSDTLLPGTGEPVWKTLFEAARRFAADAAYPDEPFPKTDDDAKCLLCQQALDENAKSRLRRFEEFIQKDTAKSATLKDEARKTAVRKITDASIGFGLDEALVGELAALDAAVLDSTRSYEAKLDSRRKWMLDTLKTHKWESPSTLDGDSRPELKKLASGLVAQATEFDKAADLTKKKLLETERAELRARVNLSQRKQPILDLIERMKLKAALTKCKDDLKTTTISNKAKEFASQAVTITLKDALNDEFVALGVGHIKTKLTERVQQGKMKHKLVLDLPVTHKLDEILSEGEQRAIAIGSFLAELRLAGHKAGIVFDDPVSSLDHYRRQDVARRLVSEAKHRQVIVLTHDTVFLAELLNEIEKQGATFLVHHVDWDGSFAGRINDGLPWEHQPYKDRIDKLEKAQRSLAKNWPPYPNEAQRSEMKQQYDRLRATIERVIQDVVFNGVIKRYDDWIRVDNLDKVVGFTDSEYKEIARLHKVCCPLVTGHDPSSTKNASVPTADQLGQDIASLTKLIEAIKTRRKPTPSTTAATVPVPAASPVVAAQRA